MKTRGQRIDRRKFLKATGAGLAGIALLPRSPGGAVAESAVVSPRQILDFNHKWLFSDKLATGATALAFNDAGFERVTIPHTNKMLPWHGFDDKDYQFVSVYRRHFRLPDYLRGRRVFVDFGGAMTAATVFLNGHRLGEYRGGYTPFSFELSTHLRWRSDNVLAVEVDSTEGFREGRFTPDGFFLNDKHVKLRGLNRHQTYPYVGQAMPARVQRRDALILKRELNCNMVRTSHYPQSPHFLDACDEVGLLVLEEIPGWQHIGDASWKDLSVRYVEDMICRDWNHPSIVLWGVRINESRDDHDFYARTNKVARDLDDSRQTGGVRNKYDSELLEDVFTMNDFQIPLRAPNHPLYLNTEFIGHMYPTKRNDNIERITEHTMRHARVHNQLASDKRYAGGLGWCAFDYNTHSYFCSGDRVCYHGVADIFRIPKPAAGLHKSQRDPEEEIVLEPAFDWARGDRNESFTVATVCSNCDHLKIYIGGRLVADVDPGRENFGNLAHPPFVANIREGLRGGWGDLRIDGFIGGKKVVSKTMSGQGRAYVGGCPAKVVKIDKDADLALLAVCATSKEAKRPTFQLTPAIDEQIILIAQPNENKFLRKGIFQGPYTYQGKQYWSIKVEAFDGFSGSPVYNRQGEVVGVFCGYDSNEGLAFISPGAKAQRFLEEWDAGIVSTMPETKLR